MLVGHRCLLKPSHPDCQPLGVGGLAEDRLEISFNRRLDNAGIGDLADRIVFRGSLCCSLSGFLGGVWDSRCSWARTGEGAVGGSGMGCWHACALLEDGKVSASPCPAREQHLQDVSSKGLF